MLVLVPLKRDAAKAFCASTHRHLKPPVGDSFRVGASLDGSLVGVAFAGRPTSRVLAAEGWLEVTRVATVAVEAPRPGVSASVSSFLYGAIRRAGTNLGYTKFITYTLLEEPGTSLRASGWLEAGMTPGGEWSCASRPRKAGQATGPKRRWVWSTGPEAKDFVERMTP